MPYITGRVNAYPDAEETEADLALFISDFYYDKMLFTRETQMKCGLSTHLHYHFIAEVNDEPEKVRAKMRKWLTEHGYAKHMSSVKVTEDRDKAIYYVLKQQDVVYYTLTDEELALWLGASKEYNEQLVINSWQEHLEEISKKISPIRYTREKALYVIHSYVIDWNKTAKKEHKISFTHLHPSKLFTLFHQIESMILTTEQAYSLLWGDASATISNKPQFGMGAWANFEPQDDD